MSMNVGVALPQMLPASGKLICCLLAKLLRRRQPNYHRLGIIALVEEVTGRMGCNSGFSSAGRQVSDGAAFGSRQGPNNVREYLTLVGMQGIIGLNQHCRFFRHRRDLRTRC